MKSLFLLLITFPFQSFSLFLDCINPAHKKEIRKRDHLVIVDRMNRGPTDYRIPAVNPNRDESILSLLIIERIVNYYDQDSKEWQLSIVEDAHNSIELIPLETKYDNIHGKKIIICRWSVKPLAPGTARIKAEFISKARDDSQIYDEKSYTITIC